MGALIDTTVLLIELDDKGIEIWKSRRGWHHAFRRHLKEYDGLAPVPVHGPFRSAVEAGQHALGRLNAENAKAA